MPNSTRNGWSELRASVKAKTAGRCAYCGKQLTEHPSFRWHVDHAIPQSRGGLSELANLLPSCPQCNRQKHTKTIEEYRDWYTWSLQLKLAEVRDQLLASLPLESNNGDVRKMAIDCVKLAIYLIGLGHPTFHFEEQDDDGH